MRTNDNQTRISVFAAVAICVIVSRSEAHDERRISDLRVAMKQWILVPTLTNGRVDSFVGLRNGMADGENITAVWFSRTVDQWRSWAWRGQDRSAAIASVKLILGLPDSTDASWPVPVNGTPAAPEEFKRGVLASDPLAPLIDSLEDPSGFVQSLELSGWRAAWLDIWSQPCESFKVLNAWAIAVEGTELQMMIDGGSTAQAEMTFTNTIQHPCNDRQLTRVFESHGFVVALNDVDGAYADGLIPDSQQGGTVIEHSTFLAGMMLIEGFIQNNGTAVLELAASDGSLTQVDPNSEIAVVWTHGTCVSRCQVLLDVIHDPPGPRIPIYAVDAKCYCCCWKGLQPVPPTWLVGLPDCPCSISVNRDGTPVNPDPSAWRNLGLGSQRYHPGAVFGMRSTCPTVNGGPGQQCCYDGAGGLLTVGGGAGTPDIVAPCGLWDIWSHSDEDVESWHYCSKAGMLDCYLFHRPPNNGNDCACNPTSHPHCTTPPNQQSCNCD